MPETTTIITDAADCNIKQFIRCAFEGKYKVLLIDGEATDAELQSAFEMIYAQYIDLSGMYQTREFELSAYINFVDNRIRTIERFIELQRLFLREFNMPFLPAFGLFKKYGHHLVWNPEYPDTDLFKKKLGQIEMKEKKYHSILNTKIKDLVEFKKKQIAGEHSLLESRKQFITTLNRLQQAKFVIDKNETSVEELALMIRDHKDQIEENKMQAKAKKYS